MVIEDQDDCREMTRLWLSGRGHRVVEAADGFAGLSLIERTTPAIAFVDLGLPGLSGYEVARRVRAQAQLDRVMLIALSGYAQQADVERALESGFDGHVAKPASPDVLDELARSAAARKIASRPSRPG